MGQIEAREIMKILPHRFPLMLIDRITELEPMVLARGYKNVTANEPVFQGHFPNNPVLPGIYMIEALAQLGGAAIMRVGDSSRKIPYLAAVDGFKFRRPVVPGDRLDMVAHVTGAKLGVGIVSVEAHVDGVLAVRGNLKFSLVDDNVGFVNDAAVLHL